MRTSARGCQKCGFSFLWQTSRERMTRRGGARALPRGADDPPNGDGWLAVRRRELCLWDGWLHTEGGRTARRWMARRRGAAACSGA